MDGVITMNDDSTLLRRFAAQRDEAALAELVGQHLGLVYHTALRRADGDVPLAEEATQATFVLLAEKAAELCTHPELAGWLHTTVGLKLRDLQRSESRRHQRERLATEMQERHDEPVADEMWSRVRPLIDDILLELPATDRAAVLLRYFEGRTFAEVGEALRLSENAARMRVERALERMQVVFAKRGVTSTSATLATVLVLPASAAVPVGLADVTIAAGTAAAGAVGAAPTVLHLLFSVKAVVVIAATTVAVSIAGLCYQQCQLRRGKAELVTLQAEQRELDGRVRRLENHFVTQAATSMPPINAARRPETSAAPAAAAEPITEDAVQARYERGLALAHAGQPEAALAELLWCFDTGMLRYDRFAGVRLSYVLTAIAELAKPYPPARAALLARRDAAEAAVVAGGDRRAAAEYAALNAALGDSDRTLVAFDTLAPEDTSRAALVGADVGGQLLAAQRYAEIVQAVPFETMLKVFDAMSDVSALRQRGMAEAQAAAIRRLACEQAAGHIEALAGAGDLDLARQLVARVLAADASAEVRNELTEHLSRAGHPELLAP